MKLELASNQCLVVEENVVRFVGPDGATLLVVRITEDGPVVKFEGHLKLEAGRVSIHGREGVVISSDGDLESRARIQNITADLGNVNIKANDDVKLNGERVMMNC